MTKIELDLDWSVVNITRSRVNNDIVGQFEGLKEAGESEGLLSPYAEEVFDRLIAGIRNVKELQAGDEVTSVNGKELLKVLAVHPSGDIWVENIGKDYGPFTLNSGGYVAA